MAQRGSHVMDLGTRGGEREMLVAAAQAVKPGGRLVYSVCTLTPMETLAVDAFAAAELPDLTAVPPPRPPWRPHGRGAILLPSDARTDGMFVLVLERVAPVITITSRVTVRDAPLEPEPSHWEPVP